MSKQWPLLGYVYGAKVETVSSGPPDRSLAAIIRNPPTLRLEPVPLERLMTPLTRLSILQKELDEQTAQLDRFVQMFLDVDTQREELAKQVEGLTLHVLKLISVGGTIDTLRKQNLELKRRLKNYEQRK